VTTANQQAPSGASPLMTAPTKRNPQVTVTLPPDLHQQLLDACERDDLPIVYWVRQAIRAKLEENK
jgi:hypothetical protein